MKRLTTRLAGVLAACMLVFTGCAGGGNAPGASGKDLILGVLAEPPSWHPAQAHVGHLLQPFQLPYDTLLLRKPDGTLAPMLATEWEYTDKKMTTLQLKLRTDVTFSDDEKFDAAAVKANLDGFKKANGRQVAMLQNYDSTTVVDPTTVTIQLTKADPAFLYYLSQAAGLMGAPNALGGADIGQVPVGSGPYTMVKEETVKGSQFVFTKRAGYWNPDLQKWDKITMRVLADITARVNAVTTGDVDATLLDATTKAQAEAQGLKLLGWPVDWSGLLLFDRDGKIVPALKDVRVRQAINYALDRQSMLKTVQQGNGDRHLAGVRTRIRILPSGTGEPLPLRSRRGQVVAGEGRLQGRLRHEAAAGPGQRRDQQLRQAGPRRCRNQSDVGARARG